jgi:multidrug efflux pump subunit AcrA (membrane-fusion protein)
MEIKRKIFKRKKLIIISASSIILVIGGIWFYKHYKQKKAHDKLIKDSTVKVEKGDIENTLNETGNITAEIMSKVTSKVSGQITDLFIKEGQYVKKNTRLMTVKAGRDDADKFIPVNITAPIAGLTMRCDDGGLRDFPYIGQRITGSYSGDPTCLMEIANMNTFLVKFSINEIDVLRISKGMNVKVEIDAIPEFKGKGKILRISPRAGGNNRYVSTFEVVVELLNKHPKIKIGMRAKVKIKLAAKKDVLKIPFTALFEDDDSYVYKQVGNDFEKTEIKTGMNSDSEIEVIEGLEEGDVLSIIKPEDLEE